MVRRMSEEPGEGGRAGGGPGQSWERRAAGLVGEMQKWLVRQGARSVRDELGDQVRKALHGPGGEREDVWAVATSEPLDEAPECAWCPVCRAARRIARARASQGNAGVPVSDLTEVMAGAIRDALAGVDAVLSYRPPPARQPGKPGEGPAGGRAAGGATAAGGPAGEGSGQRGRDGRPAGGIPA